MLDRTFSRRSLLRLAGFVIPLVLIMVPADSLAIHAILKDGEPIPREHGPLFLGMPLSSFLQEVKGKEEPPGIGQFQQERRFNVDPSFFSPEVKSVVCEFYKEVLFRIELNHRPVQKPASSVSELKEQWSHRFGSARINSFPGSKVSFWDDGKTRLIFQEDEEEKEIVYSATYIDNALFHQASRERVQLETDGKSTYGK